MWLVIALLACGGAEPDRRAPRLLTAPTSSTTQTTPWSPPPGALGACEREADYAEWPGGRRLRLHATQPTIDGLTTLTVTGADPSERVVFHLGDACTLECPAELDGACFQGVDSQVLGEVLADAAGEARLDVRLHPDWAERWLLLQATAPDARAISQAWVDTPIEAPAWGTVMGDAGRAELSPATLRNQYVTFHGEQWVLQVGAGRRVRLTWDSPSKYDDVPRACIASDSILDCVHFDQEPVIDRFHEGPSGWLVEAGFEYDWELYHLDVETLPLDAPVDWYPDLDGDGYGDPNGAPVSSTVPVDGFSAHPGDCDDAEASLRPFGAEVCGDGIDQDCDGADRVCSEIGAGAIAEAGTLLLEEALTWYASWLLAVDLDADGATELLTSGAAWDVTRADALEPAPGWHAASAAVGDLTGDGVDDLVLAQDAVRIVAGPVALDGAAPVDLLPGVQATQIAVGDLTGDGADDLVALVAEDGEAEVRVYPAPVVAGGESHIPLRIGYGAKIALADADGDGVLDLWTSDGCLHLGGAVVAEGCIEIGHGLPAIGGLSVADVDGDGIDDAIFGASDGVRVVNAPPVGEVPADDVTWLRVVPPASPFAAYASAVTPDRDGDGAPEIVVSRDGEVRWVSALAGGVVDAAVDGRVAANVPGEAMDLIVLGGDLDGDGAGDLAIAGFTTHEDRLFAGSVRLLWGP